MGKWKPTRIPRPKGGFWVELVEAWQVERANMAYWQVTCKFCGGTRVVKYGTYHGVQRFLCRSCNRKFADNNAPPHMQFPTAAIASALNQFYQTTSLDKIRTQLDLDQHPYPGHATVYEWVVKYTKKAVEALSGVTVNTGKIWVADETMLLVAGSKTKEGSENTAWFWDVLDEDSRFLLASHLSQTRTTRDAETLFQRAAEVATRPPRFIVTDKLSAYLDGIERVFGGDTIHIQSHGMRSSTNINLVERFHGTIKDRTNLMRGLHSLVTARFVMSGWAIHYNYMRKHQALGGKTPAEVAGVEAPFKSWLEVIQLEGRV